MDGGRFYHFNHVAMCTAASEGPDASLIWCAKRSAFASFAETALPLLASIHEPYSCQRLGLTPPAGGDGGRPVAFDCAEPWFLQERELLFQNRRFKSALTSNLIWLEAMFYVNFPCRVVVVYHPDLHEIKKGFLWMRKLSNAIVKAEALVKSDPAKFAALKNILETIYYLGEQTPREFFHYYLNFVKMISDLKGLPRRDRGAKGDVLKGFRFFVVLQ